LVAALPNLLQLEYVQLERDEPCDGVRPSRAHEGRSCSFAAMEVFRECV
jgi:hypothetical protein